MLRGKGERKKKGPSKTTVSVSLLGNFSLGRAARLTLLCPSHKPRLPGPALLLARRRGSPRSPGRLALQGAGPVRGAGFLSYGGYGAGTMKISFVTSPVVFLARGRQIDRAAASRVPTNTDPLP